MPLAAPFAAMEAMLRAIFDSHVVLNLTLFVRVIIVLVKFAAILVAP
jgi:hypothetical protein